MRLLLLLAFLSLAAALQILRPAENETIHADVEYDLQWKASPSDPQEAILTLLSSNGHEEHGRWRITPQTGNFTFRPSYADAYNPKSKSRAKVRLEISGLTADAQGVIDTRVLAATNFYVNGTSWEDRLMPEFQWSAPPKPSRTPRSAEEQARLLNAASSAARRTAGGVVMMGAAAAVMGLAIVAA